ncbi:MAG TPA: hypothetical protein VM221_06035, partial [Armatimonadota bacterium]|nr:hypothetical protein [Armatimonadota bacterium]
MAKRSFEQYAPHDRRVVYRTDSGHLGPREACPDGLSRPRTVDAMPSDALRSLDSMREHARWIVQGTYWSTGEALIQVRD